MAKKKSSVKTLFNFPIQTWVDRADTKKAAFPKGTAYVGYFARRDEGKMLAFAKKHLQPYQIELLKKHPSEAFHMAGKQGPVWIFHPSDKSKAHPSHEGLLEMSPFARARDQVPSVLAFLNSYKCENMVVELFGTSLEDEKGILVGLELAAYRFSEFYPAAKNKKLPKLYILGASSDLTDAEWKASAYLGLSVNIARHLTNLPGGALRPQAYAQAVKDLFASETTVDVEVWKGEKLEKERMNLLRAVGRAGSEPPCMVLLKYRPARRKDKKASHKKPIALVGKGITFDTGGLDIKPSSGMRWMKKDMGGSAAVVGLMHWAAKVGYPDPIDGYLAIAENSVASDAFRPGDIITARNGAVIEIHNTDAEGRLVLADVLDVAINSDPRCVIDLATLTGAIKVGLGAELAGLFTNHDGLADMLTRSGQWMGDLNWRMPLYSPYRSLLKSNFAEMANASDGFAGAITAALFLQRFTAEVPWAHLDIYAWKDSASGAYAEAGGSGQGVLCLSDAFNKLVAYADF